MNIVGFTGPAGAGKDTCASFLAADARLAFATPLKEAARALFGFSTDQLYGSTKNEVDARWGKSPREVLQWLGTDVIREQLDKDHFLKRMRFELEAAEREGRTDVVVTDVRYDNEAELLRSLGGKIVCVHRSSIQKMSHVSEAGISPHLIDVHIHNEGTLEELRGTLLHNLEKKNMHNS